MDVQEGYMLKKIMMVLVATNVVASRPPKGRPTGTSTALMPILTLGMRSPREAFYFKLKTLLEHSAVYY